jgi:hypothetical protein
MKAGERIYYTGDMANVPAFGTVVEVAPVNEFGNIKIMIRFDGVDRLKTSWDFDFAYRGPGKRLWLATEWQALQASELAARERRAQAAA